MSRTAADRWALAVVAGIAGVVAAAPSPASASAFTQPRAVSPAGLRIAYFSLATSATGSRTVLLYQAGGYRRGPRVRLVARLGRGTELGPPRTLPSTDRGFGGVDGGVDQGRAAVGADETVVAVWRSRTLVGLPRVRVAIAPRGRGFGPARTVAEGAGIEQLGDALVGRDGSAIVTWRRRTPDGNVVEAAHRPAGGTFGAPQLLGGSDSSAPQLASADGGRVVAAWGTPVARAGGAQTQAAVAIKGPAEPAFAPPTVISDAPEGVSAVDATRGRGAVGVSYVATVGRGAEARSQLRYHLLGLDGSLSAPGAFGARVGQGIQRPALIVGRGEIGAAWRVYTPTAPGVYRASRANPVGRLLDGPLGAGPPVAAAVGGGSLVAWPDRTASGAARLHVAPSRGRAVVLSRGRRIGSVALSAGDRHALLAWLESDGPERVRLRLAAYAASRT